MFTKTEARGSNYLKCSMTTTVLSTTFVVVKLSSQVNYFSDKVGKPLWEFGSTTSK